MKGQGHPKVGEDLERTWEGVKEHGPGNSISLVCEVGRDALSQMAGSARTYYHPPPAQLPFKGWEGLSPKV